jgi:hypothetical protein
MGIQVPFCDGKPNDNLKIQKKVFDPKTNGLKSITYYRFYATKELVEWVNKTYKHTDNTMVMHVAGYVLMSEEAYFFWKLSH